MSSIRKWNPSSVLGVPGQSPSLVVVGTRNSGKTVLCRSLVTPLLEKAPEKGGYDHVFVCSRNAVTLTNWADIIPIDGAEEPFVDLRETPNFLELLTNTLASQPNVRTPPVPPSITPKSRQRRTLVIMDDFLEIGRTRYEKALNEFYTAGRHYGVTIISITQSMSELSTSIRRNTSVTIIGRITNGSEISTVTDDYLKWCLPHDPDQYPRLPGDKKDPPRKKQEYLLALYRACTAKKNYSWLVVDNTQRATFDEAIHWYRCEL